MGFHLAHASINTLEEVPEHQRTTVYQAIPGVHSYTRESLNKGHFGTASLSFARRLSSLGD